MKKINFCLNKKFFYINNSAEKFLSSYENSVELPIESHPGSFGFKRKNHIHEGIDFYCEENDEVYSVEDGIVIDIKNFTGESVGSHWWNETQMIFIKHKNFCLNYGEIIVNKNIKIGDEINCGQHLGNVKTVLKKNKGRPMTMLHIEMYEKNIKTSVDSWNLNNQKPIGLIDPTIYFLENFFKHKEKSVV